MRRSRIPAFVAVLVLSLLLVIPAPVTYEAAGARAQDATPQAAASATHPLILFAAPGIRRDLVEAYAAEGAVPALSALMTDGADGNLREPFSASTGTALPTLLSGAWPAEHGVVGDVFYRTGSPSFADWASWDDPGLIQADTLPQAAERAGKVVVAVGWRGLAGLDPAIDGPVVGDAIAFSQSGVVTTSPSTDLTAAAAARGVAYDNIVLRPAEGWSDAPESFSPAQEAEFTVRSLDPDGPNPDRAFVVYVYDTTDDAATNYDAVVVAPEKSAAPVAELGAGSAVSIPVALSGERAGEVAGLWVSAIDLAADLSQFELYYSPVSRIEASWNGCSGRHECTGPGGFEEFVNETLGVPLPADVAALEAGIIDAETFGLLGQTGAAQRVDVLSLVIERLGVKPDLLLLESSFPGEATRALAGPLAQSGATGTATPISSDADGSAAGEQLRVSYMGADQLVTAARAGLGPEATTFAVFSDGLASSWRAVDAGRVLVDAGLAEEVQPDNCVPGPVSAPPGTPEPDALPVGPAVKACWSGGTAQIYVNLDGREAAGSVAEDAYDATREAIAAAFNGLRDPENSDATVVADVYLQEELRDLNGVDALHPSRSGDVVVTLAPPYRFESVEGVAVGPASTLAVDGYAVDDSGGWLLAAGPAITQGATVESRAIDVAPTAAFLLDMPGPLNASGDILFDALAIGPSVTQVTLLDISDFHGQLPPLSAAADAIDAEGAVNSSYPVGGIAALGAWFDRYRTVAIGPVLLTTAGDAVGATPPISTAFGDMPTIELMNMLGFSADSLGNHNFDAGAEYMFGTLQPLADFPFLSANLVPARADAATPAPGEAPFQPSILLEEDGVKVGLVGYSNPDIPNLTRPGALGLYRVIDPVQPIDEEAAKLRAEGSNVVIALGHMGATGGTLTEPTGPAVELADQVQGVDIVVADHTDVQVSSVRPNGVLLVENRSKGVMFTRVRVVIDRESGELIYRTADFHRPWVIGMSPDPAIVERLDQLQSELAPTLGQVIGSATQVIPRSDACGMETGRTCESLIGDVITDAMRFTYGTDFALTNSGGIRADLTCPLDGGDFCPTGGEANQISQGQVLTVLPFGNVAVTLELNGAELKEMLEIGVGRMPEPSGGFPQVSGLCFTYDENAEPGNRVTSAVRQADDGSCTGEAVDLTDASTYTLTTNDFTASGGDGYPELISRASSRDVLAQVVADVIAAESPLSLPGEPLDPTIEGRIVCEGEVCPVPAPE